MPFWGQTQIEFLLYVIVFVTVYERTVLLLEQIELIRRLNSGIFATQSQHWHSGTWQGAVPGGKRKTGSQPKGRKQLLTSMDYKYDQIKG